MLSNNLQSVTQAQVLHVAPETLFDHLTGKIIHFNQLLETLDCNPADLAATLKSPDFDQRLQVHTQLALLQAKLIAATALPSLLLQLIDMAKDPATGKETTRRCITTIMHIGGLSTTPPKPEPKPQPRQYDPDQLSSDEQTAIDNLIALEKDYGLDLARLTKDQRPAFVNHLHKFLQPQGYAQTQEHLKANAQSQAATLQKSLAQTAPPDSISPIGPMSPIGPIPPNQLTPNPAKQALPRTNAPLDLPNETILPQHRDPDDQEDDPTFHQGTYTPLP